MTREALVELLRQAPGQWTAAYLVVDEDAYETVMGDGYSSQFMGACFDLPQAIQWVDGACSALWIYECKLHYACSCRWVPYVRRFHIFPVTLSLAGEGVQLYGRFHRATDADDRPDLDALIEALDVSSRQPLAARDAEDPEIKLRSLIETFRESHMLAKDVGALHTAGATAVPALIEGLRDTDLREPAIRFLSGLGPEAAAAAPSLVALLADPIEKVRVRAAGALWRVQPSSHDVIPALIMALEGRDPTAMNEAVDHLVEVGGEAVQWLVALSQHDRPEVRKQALSALGRLGQQRGSGQFEK